MNATAARLAIVLILLTWVAACTGPNAAEDGERPRRRAPAGQAAGVELRLAPMDPSVATVQLYPTREGEGRLPIVALRSGQTLTLGFDLVREQGRPLSAYFYHADRTWERDLSPSQYLQSFQRDNLLDYTPSLGTDVRYTHYAYTFPNDAIDFTLSGNYILRVTEQGAEDEPLFEVPFFVTEQLVPAELSLERVLLGASFAGIQPAVRVGRLQQGNVFDFAACFVQNGQLGGGRCVDRPALSDPGSLLFNLEREQSFAPDAPEYVLDLSSLQPGPSIEQVDRTTRPYTVRLEPDYARFGASALAPRLYGQPVVRSVVRDVADPGIAAPYVEVVFRYVPPEEQPLSAPVYVVGSFGGWQAERAVELAWQSADGWYEGKALIKQGQYEYRYTSRDPALARALRRSVPRADNLYTSFVYYDDLTAYTDRLIAVAGALAR